jgi:chaperonin GroEL (HSP60 family)
MDGEILSNGKEVLDNIELGPMAEPILKSVDAQYKEFRDGTVSLALLLSKMIVKAHDLSNSGIDMPTIISGYRKAMDVSIEVARKRVKKIEGKDIEILKDVIKHSVANTIADRDNILSAMRDSILFLKEPKEEDIKVLAEEGEEGSEVIVGLKLDYNRIREDMPDKLNDVKIALLDKISPRKTNLDIKINIVTAENYSAAAKFEEIQIKEAIDELMKLGVKAVFSKGEIDLRAAEIMTREGITGFEKIKDSDMTMLAQSSGGNVVNVSNISESDLGYIGVIDDTKEEGCVGGVCKT